MPVVTFTVRRGLSAADKSRLSEAMLEAQVAAGYHRADRFHRFLEVDQDDLLVDPRFPGYATDRTDRFMVVEVVISSGRPTATAATIADEAVRLFGERLHLAPQDILFAFHEVKANLPRFPAASIRQEATADVVRCRHFSMPLTRAQNFVNGFFSKLLPGFERAVPIMSMRARNVAGT
jgi:hypothetical protein